MKLSYPRSSAVLALILNLCARIAPAAPGDLDTTFGNGGMLTIGFGGTADYAHSSVLQADGKMIMLGSSENVLTLVRLGTNGLPDFSFGYQGKTVFSPSQYPYQTPEFVRLQSDGKIIVASDTSSGSSYYIAISRFDTNGNLDTTFNSPDGFAVRSFSSQSQKCVALAVLADNRIAFAGNFYVPNGSFGEPRYFITRILADGGYDPALPGGGFISTNYSSLNDMIIQFDNKFLVAGNDNNNVVMRFNEDGTRDLSFGSGGKVTIPTASSVKSVAIQQGDFTISNPDKIVAVGGVYNPPSNAVVIARMSMSGVLDSNFGGGAGYVTRLVGMIPDVTKVFVLNSGVTTRTIYLIGKNNPSGIPKLFLAKFNAAGTMDTTYGGGVGIVSTSIGPNAEDIYDALPAIGGKFLLTCASNPDNPNQDADYTVVRYLFSTGLLDTNFGTGGILEYNVGDLDADAKAVAIQSDGRTLISGDANSVIGFARLNGNGTYDTSFGSNGKLLFAVSNYACHVHALTLLPDGRFLIAGSATINGKDNVLLARFLSNGVPDTTFGTTGVVTTAVGTNSAYAQAIRLQNDGKILIGGGAPFSGQNAFLVMRYMANGTLDTSWNGTGFNVTGVGANGDQLAGVTVLADGKVMAGGYSVFGGNTAAKFSVTRYLTTGALDNAFGSFGRLAFNVSPNNVDAAVAFFSQPDGKIVMTGYSFNSALTDSDIGIARINTDGSFDANFNGSGKLVTSIGLGTDYGIGGAVQSDNKLVIGAATTIGAATRFGLLQLTTNGVADSDFGFGGRNYYDFGTSAAETPAALAVDAAGRIVMVGTVNNIFGIVRVLGRNYVLQITSIQRLGNGHMLLNGIGVPSSAHTLQKSSVLSPAAFGPLDGVTTDSAGNWQYEDTTAGSATNRFYRLSYP